MVDLISLVEKQFTDSEHKTPKQISDEVFAELTPSEYEEVVRLTLPAFVQKYMVTRRRPVPVSDEPAVEETTFASDDLLSDDVAQAVEENVRKKVAQSGSRKVDRIRAEWQRQLQNRVYNGSEYKIFSDFTASDLKNAASALRSQAEAFQGKADKYEKYASLLKDGQTLGEFDKDPLG